MKRIIILLLILLSYNITFAQRSDREKRLKKDNGIENTKGIEDRASSVITINELGQTVTNLGQFHPFGGVMPAGRWPIGTDHDQIYKMNVYVGIPNNVVQTRASSTKEWDAMPGFHNPDSGKVAISTNPNTWPRDNSGNPYWPVQTADGKDSILSQEDTYAVYKDLTNARAADDPSQRLNIRMEQTTYAWSTSKDNDYIVIKFDCINDTTVARDSFYFALYCDFDAGGIENDYEDDLWGFEKERDFFYIYDSDNNSADWRGSKPFQLGVTFLETPQVNGERKGITDWHYSSDGDSPWGDIVEEDQILYEWMSSNERLKNDPNWPNLFHGSNLKYDDVSKIDPNGERLDCIASSGPYTIQPGEKLTFIVALVAGEDYEDISQNVNRVKDVYNNGLQLVPPPKPEINAEAFNNRVQLTWSNVKEFEYIDSETGESLIEEYRVYKTEDPERKEWGDPIAVIKRDSTIDGIDDEAYFWEDIDVSNYFYYSYSITTYDKDGLESGKSFLPADALVNENTTEVRPVDQARESLKDVKVVPNPYVISSSWERKRLGDPILGEPIRDLAFINLPERCTIKIFTIDGDLVKVIEHSNGKGTAFWDIRSDSNQHISTGIYFYHIESDSDESIGKFAVVR